MKPVSELLKVQRLARKAYSGYISEHRVPYTYADDFLRLHPAIVPEEYVKEPITSRAAAGLTIERWAKGIGVSTEELAEVLCQAYCEEWHLYEVYSEDK